jgi:hypothetical protein
LTSEKHLAPSTIRSCQGEIRLFTEFLIDGRYGWGPACEEAFSVHPVAIAHEWNTLPHLQHRRGSPACTLTMLLAGVSLAEASSAQTVMVVHAATLIFA